MKLKTMTQSCRPFVGYGLKGEGTQVDPGKTFVGDGFLKTSDIEKGGPKKLKRLSGAPPLRDIGSFPEDLSRIYQGRSRGRQIRRRRYPWQAGVLEKHVPFPSCHGHHGQVTPDAEVGVKKQGQFSYGATMTHGDGVHADERGVFRSQAIAFQTVSPNRVWTVQHENLFAMGTSRLKA